MAETIYQISFLNGNISLLSLAIRLMLPKRKSINKILKHYGSISLYFYFIIDSLFTYLDIERHAWYFPSLALFCFDLGILSISWQVTISNHRILSMFTLTFRGHKMLGFKFTVMVNQLWLNSNSSINEIQIASRWTINLFLIIINCKFRFFQPWRNHKESNLELLVVSFCKL